MSFQRTDNTASKYELPFSLFVPHEDYICSNLSKPGNSAFTYDPQRRALTFTKDAALDQGALKKGEQYIGAEPERDITADLDGADQFVCLTQLGTVFNDYSSFNGILLDDIVLDYRENVGEESKGKSKIVRASQKKAGYGLSYISIGIKKDLLDFIVTVIAGTHKIRVSIGKHDETNDHYWINSNISTQPLMISYATKDGSVMHKDVVQIMHAVKSSIIGIAHINLQLKRTLKFDNYTTEDGPVHTLSFPILAYQMRDRTSFKSPGIGAVKSSGAVAGYATIDTNLEQMINARTSGRTGGSRSTGGALPMPRSQSSATTSTGGGSVTGNALPPPTGVSDFASTNATVTV